MQRLATIRRRLALFICPELVDLPPAAGQAALPRRLVSELDAQNRARVRAEQERADKARRLDRLFAAHTGIVLTPDNWKAAGAAAGSRKHALSFAAHKMAALRARPEAGIQSKTLREIALGFAEVWPADLEWPRDIPRPAKFPNPKEAA